MNRRSSSIRKRISMQEEYKPDTNEVVNEWLEMYEKYMGKGGEKE